MSHSTSVNSHKEYELHSLFHVVKLCNLPINLLQSFFCMVTLRKNWDVRRLEIIYRISLAFYCACQ